MRTTVASIVTFFLLAVMVGCSAAPRPSAARAAGAASPAATSTPASVATATTAPATPTDAATATPAPTEAVAPPAATPAATSTTPSTAVDKAATAAIQAVIQKANQEQQDAFAKHNPALMQDTATSSYYDELVQINDDMASNGVAAIKLLKLEWGAVSLTNATSAQATTYETWQTSYSDGTTDQSRDRNVYTLVQQQGAWRIQADDHPDAGLDQPTGPTLPAPSVSLPPAPPTGISPPSLPAPLGRTDVSHNWSGYAASGDNFTTVTGTWTVPQTQGTTSFGSAATWVGIGGVRSRDLIQAGTEDTTVGSGRVRYDAWIELLPATSHPVPLAVSPGDSVTVAITEQGTDQWLIAFTNNTTGKTYQTTVQYTSSHSSAEWVEEAPSTRRTVVPLDNFGTVQFSGGTAVENGKTVTIAQSGAQPITMIDARGNALATPSGLSADGKGFGVTRTSQSAVQPAPGRGLGAFPGTFPTIPID